MTSYFFLQADQNHSNNQFITDIRNFSDNNKVQFYLINKPLGDEKYSYGYSNALILLSSDYKISFIDFDENEEGFEDYYEDVLEDIGSISDKYLYKNVIGRPRRWRDKVVNICSYSTIQNVNSFLESIKLDSPQDRKLNELIISLFTGSINDIERVKAEIPETLLDKVKQKIQLFDGDQTRFVYEQTNDKIIRIQGLSGTGKTELLLHKLKELYTTNKESRIFFTCHNKILAHNIRNRIPEFFNFMKVEQQIEWEKRLWCRNAWGSLKDSDSGAYRYICSVYGLTFRRFTYSVPFSEVCRLAIDEINSKFNALNFIYAFDYILIDESQDFPEEFIALAKLVTKENIYLAGDIFQSIFDKEISSSIEPDYLLGKCYRTDPKTLMFAHALGMGLFENPKLRWLEEKEWIDCGYEVEKDNNKVILSRQPLKRFEDMDPDFESIRLISEQSNIPKKVVDIIEELKAENNTITPSDIGIILLDSSKSIYQLADQIEVNIRHFLRCNVNKAYETKTKIPNSILISNRNNVKGLEFPFVICITKNVTRNPSYRNSLYTMISRSFIRTYLIYPEDSFFGFEQQVHDGLKEIIDNKRMIINEPSPEEKENINTTFEYEYKKISHYDLMSKVLKLMRIDLKHIDKYLAISQEMEMIEADEETLINFVKDTTKYLKLK